MNNEAFIVIALAALAILPMAYVSRMAGGGGPKLPLGLDQWLYSLPYALLAPATGLWAVLAYSGAFLSKRTGHGRGMSLKEPMKPGSEPEKLEYLILWLQPYLPNYVYKCLILAVIGIAGKAGAAIALAATGNIVAGLFTLISGLGKPVAYMIGWTIFPDGGGNNDDYPEEFNEATELGEGLSGLFDGITLTISLLIVYL